MNGAVEGTGCCRVAVDPVGLAPSEFTGFYNTDNTTVKAGGKVAERIAAAKTLVPDALAELFHGHGAGKHECPLLGSDDHENLPFFTDT